MSAITISNAVGNVYIVSLRRSMQDLVNPGGDFRMTRTGEVIDRMKGWRSRFKPLRRLTALVMIYVLLHSQGAVAFYALKAETAGASAPEVTKFEPVDTTDMVNLASGDFNYAIPVINVPGPEGGYPLALSYHSGIQHGEEASWVGLGWNLQPGAIARAQRGYPDDFKSVGITTNYLSNVYETYAIQLSSVGVSYTTYKGWGGYVGLSASGTYYYGPFFVRGSIGVKRHWGSEGAYWSGDASVTAGVGYADGANASVGLSSHWDERGGWSWGARAGIEYGDSNGGASVNANWSSTGGTSYNLGITLKSIDQVSGTKNTTNLSASYASYSGGGQQSESIGFGPFGYTRSWIDKNEDEIAYGYFYHTEPDPLIEAGKTRINEWTMESDQSIVPGDSKEHALTAGLNYLPSNDGYSVMGQGTGGGLKLTRREDRVYKPRRLIDEWTEASSWPWFGVPEKNYKPQFVFEGDNAETFSNPELVGLSESQLAAKIKDPNDLLSSQVSQADVLSSSTEFFLGKDIQRGSRVVKERMGGLNESQFVGFDVWEQDGKHYTYGEPVWNWNSTSISANKNIIGSGEWFRSKSVINHSFAYAWYLTELKFPDYLDNDSIIGLSDGDPGGWVKFGYIVGANYYNWNSASDGQLNDGPFNRIDKLGKQKAGMMFSVQSGVKQIKYLNSIETPTHRAVFATSPRLDGKEIRAVNVPIANTSVYITRLSESDDTYQINIKSNPALIGVEIDANKWQIIPSGTWEVPILSGACEGNVSFQKTTVANLVGSNKAFAINGVPLVATSVKHINSVEYREQPVVDSPPICREISRDEYYITVRMADQFWNNSAPGAFNPAAFQSIRNKWLSMLNTLVEVGTPGMLKLDDIYLIEKSTNTLIKQVHFNYSYRLSAGTPNSQAELSTPENVAFGVQATQGKLTLESIQTFGQGGSADAESKLPPYRFEYANNPAYGDKYKHDRWGFHKSDGGLWRHRESNPSDQSAWCLSKITLPTGGTVQILYEPKDYARVQDRAPLNSHANQAAIANYLIDLKPWISDIPWPTTNSDWVAFKARVSTTPFHLFPPGGTTANGTIIPRAESALTFNTIPIQTAPNPIDLKLWLKLNSPTYRAKLGEADSLSQLGSPALKVSAIIGGDGLAVTVPDGALPLSPQEASNLPIGESPTVDRMVNLIFEYWTAGTRLHKRLKRPLKYLEAADVASEGDDDRSDVIVRSVLARMKRTADNGVDLFVVDPDFDWPKEPPSSMYVTWTANPATPKVGGGVRVKRIVSFDGRRSFTTGYSYTDFVDGVWTSSGVAAQEPPPYGYSSDDDRVVQTEKGGWANEVGGGIYHSRVIVRHSWTEDPLPAGMRHTDASGLPTGIPVQTPMGETVFRFITPADLPHRQKAVEYAKTTWKDAAGILHLVTPSNPLPTDPIEIKGLYTNSVRLTEIMNVGAWWGKLLWKEDRDKTGRPLNRMENEYTQLEGYLRLLPSSANNVGHTSGFDPDVERAWGGEAIRNRDMSYSWAPRNDANPNMPRSVKKEDSGGVLGVEFPDGSPGYLNASVNITVIEAKTSQRASVRFKPSLAWKTADGVPEYDDPIQADPEPPGWHSSISAVREMNIPPVVSEVRTYGEGLNLFGVMRNVKWDARTGGVLESHTRGRKVASGYEWFVNRTWPAYWIYGGMDNSPSTGAEWAVVDSNNARSRDTIKNMLSQPAQSTTSRLSGAGTEFFLNSKVDTWWQPNPDLNGEGRWLKGGQFVWNGIGNNLKPIRFAGFNALWNPNLIATVGLQPYKANPDNWIFSGASVLYDAYSHVIEAVDGDGVWGCSKYGYPYTNNGQANVSGTGSGILPSGTLPVAKFTNAKNAETRYWNFEGPNSGDLNMRLDALTPAVDGNPMQRLATAYSGEHAYDIGAKDLPVPLPDSGPDEFEFRCFVKAGSAQAAKAVYPIQTEVVSITQAEGGWWFLRAKATRSTGAIRTLRGAGCFVDDVAIFPWRNNGAPVSVSHYAYDRSLGLVSSITGSNGRTTRYQYDKLGRLMKVYDVYGKPTAATRYGPAVP